MATGGDTLENFPTKKSDIKDDGADLTAIPPSLKHAERRGTEEFAALQLQQELARMQMQFQKEVCLVVISFCGLVFTCLDVLHAIM